MNLLTAEIKKLSQQYSPDYVAIRRHLHAHPELSYREVQTAAFVQAELNKIGISNQLMSGTGVVGTIEGKDAGSRVIALRADMDALPIQEENNVPYRSSNPGVMHACGHDVHTSILLGAARILFELKEHWSGTIKLIFQPGEEKNPGGASYMIRDGVLSNPSPQGIIALHVHPGLPCGQLSFRKGRVMASADEIYITIRGRGGHAAAPHLTADTLLIASHLVVSLQQVISRNNNPVSPSVLSICSIQGGHTTNVIPSEVKLMGTFRAMDEEWRYRAHEIIQKQTKALVEGMGAEADVHIDIGYPAVDNHPDFTEEVWQCAANWLGKDKVSETELRMGAEDFGYYSQQIPGCFFRLGVRNESRGIVHGVHTPLFDIDEHAIEIGMGIMAFLGANVQPVTS